MTSGQRQQGFPTRSGVRRRGDEYQDGVALEIMVDWLEHTDRYQWMQVEANDRGALDDVVAFDTRNVLHVWQVKHAAHPDSPDDAYTWDTLLTHSEGRRGRTTHSLLQKWAQSLERLQREYTEVDACVTSNRGAAPDLQAALSPQGLVDFDAIADEQARRAIASQLGSEAQARASCSWGGRTTAGQT